MNWQASTGDSVEAEKVDPLGVGSWWSRCLPWISGLAMRSAPLRTLFAFPRAEDLQPSRIWPSLVLPARVASNAEGGFMRISIAAALCAVLTLPACATVTRGSNTA